MTNFDKIIENKKMILSNNLVYETMINNMKMVEENSKELFLLLNQLFEK